MSTQPAPFVERRQHLRVPTHGAVLLRLPGQDIHGRLVTISDIALDVQCQMGFGLLGLANAPVVLELCVDGLSMEWRFTGRVQFIRAATHTLVIQYDAPRPALATMIAEHIAKAGADAARMQLMLRTRDHDERARSEREDERDVGKPRRQEPS